MLSRDSNTRQKAKVRYLTVSNKHVGQRLDNFLMRELKGLPKSRIYRLLRKGEVRVNRARVDVSYRICQGDQIRIPPVRLGPPKMHSTLDVEIGEILLEDEHILALNKPSGSAVHGGSGIPGGLIEALREKRDDFGFLELAHRLDKHTSGCLLLAKSREALLGIHHMLRSDGQIKKIYIALVAGQFDTKPVEVMLPLKKNTLKSGERMVSVDDRGLTAHSIFNAKKIFPEVSMVQITLLTGRTHQARVHANSIGCPIIGDQKYGNKSLNKKFKAHGVNRLCLHAHRLNFHHPVTGKICHIKAPIPDLFNQVLTAVEK